MSIMNNHKIKKSSVQNGDGNTNWSVTGVIQSSFSDISNDLKVGKGYKFGLHTCDKPFRCKDNFTEHMSEHNEPKRTCWQKGIYAEAGFRSPQKETFWWKTFLQVRLLQEDIHQKRKITQAFLGAQWRDYTHMCHIRSK